MTRDLRAEAKITLDRMTAHIEQVDQGLLPADSPSDFVVPDPPMDEKGWPWWFGPDYHPTLETLEGS